MSVRFRNYDPEPLFGRDYQLLRDFLIRLDSSNYHFGRWDWMITHSHLDRHALPKIGLWLENGEVAAAATFDCKCGNAFLLMDDHHRHLAEEMLLYAQHALAEKGKFGVLIPDGDIELQDVAAQHGYSPTQEKECDAVYLIGTDRIRYSLPDGFSITDMAKTCDLYQYGRVLWKGFDHEENEGPFVLREENLPEWEIGFKRPNVDPALKIAVVAPNGDFVSYCGMWYDKASANALVEPVATDPEYRRMGLGRAAVLEGIRRCAMLGARRAYVGSSQQFYYDIGFRPYASSSWWKRTSEAD